MLGVAVTARVAAAFDARNADGRRLRARRSCGARASCSGSSFCANAPYAAVHLSEFRYRTELMSRVWASLALAVVFAFLQSRPSAWSRRAGVAMVLAFVGLGILGGLERQDYFVAYSRRHAAELGSLRGGPAGDGTRGSRRASAAATSLLCGH